MKKIASLFLFWLFSYVELSGQAYSPIATTGYTLDAISENTTAVLTTGGTIDGSDYSLQSVLVQHLLDLFMDYRPQG